LALLGNESLQVLDYFCHHLLKHFGDYEDAMHTDEKFLFHSVSFAMNSKCFRQNNRNRIAFYHANETTITISQVEGFVRQILGWREYIRGIYWKEMPNYAQMNVLENKNKAT
jgi:deoxyribodipyrimidine photolyase-related protein